MLKQLCKISLAVFATCIGAAASHNAQIQKPQALGQVVRSSAASLGGVVVPSGGTLVAGDVMSTAKGGGALVRFAADSQIDVLEDTTVTFSGTPDHVLAKVEHGAVVGGASGADAIVIETPQCRVQSAGQGSTSYSVSVASGGVATITAAHGTVAVTEISSAQRHVVGENETWTCPNPAAAGQPREESKPGAGEQAGQAPAPAPSHSNTGLLVLLIGGGAAAGIGAAVAAGGKGGSSGGPASPSAP